MSAPQSTATLPRWRLRMLQLAYLILVLGLGVTVWPQILSPDTVWPLKSGVVAAMLGALGLLAILGLRRPIEMLPVLLFEVAWKAIWLLRIALPAWQAGDVAPALEQVTYECLGVIPFLILIPWDEVWRRLIR